MTNYLLIFIFLILGIKLFGNFKNVTLTSNTGVSKKLKITILSILTLVIIATVFIVNNLAVYPYLKELFTSVSTR